METLLEAGAFFESPRWHEGRWWFSDFFRRVVVTAGEREDVDEVLQVDGRPSGLGWLPDGSLLVVSMLERRLLRRLPGGELALHADLSLACDWHANDMVVAVDGSAYVGNFGFDLGNQPARPTALVRVPPDGGSAMRVGEGLLFPNGAVITDDGRTLVVCETWASRLTAFDVEPDGLLANRRVWAVVPRTAPDGCTLDAEGCVWFADARSNRCLRVAEGGAAVGAETVPDGLRCFACMLGGDDGRTLAICAAPDYDERARSASLASVVFVTQVDVPRAGLP
jgi:sugar lactone lactonase YvrE